MEEGKRSSRSSSIRKLSDGERENMASSIDRLSGLPDDVICRILSFLPTKLSVATSILSRRWRFLWANVPILDLNDDSHGGGTRFSHIIQRVLLQHKGQNIGTFNLFHTEDGSDFEFETWIMNLISRNVQNLDICLCYQLTLPRCLFTCKTLVDLSVTCCGDIPMSGNVYFPALKKLRLDGVMFESDESLPHLLSGCPVLEELIIKRDNSLKTVVCCYICSPTLKRLEHDLIIEDAKNKAYQLKLDTPTLRYLRSHDFVSRKVSAGALTSLTEADVGFDARLEMDVLYSRSALEFVGRLYNVKCLKLSTGCMKIPDSAFFALTTRFHNLTELELRADWRFISYFLENADNLEVLTFNMIDGYPKYWMEPHQVPTCLSSCLKTVTIHQFRCTEAGFELIGYILRNSEVLKLMEIYSMIYGIDLKGKFDAVKRISKFQRGSKACEVEFH